MSIWSLRLRHFHCGGRGEQRKEEQLEKATGTGEKEKQKIKF